MADVREDMKQRIGYLEEVPCRNNETLFCTPFYGMLHDAVRDLCEIQLSRSPQERNFIALIQASMSGKTRILLEVSLKKPLLMIAFKQNTAYYALVKDVKRNHLLLFDSFEEKLFHNTIILLKIWIFLYSYFIFFQTYLEIREKQQWNELNINEKKVLNLLLINGGGDLLKNIFINCLSKRQIPSEYSIDNHALVDSLNEKFCNEYSELSTQLGNPWFAFDECNVPNYDCIGKLFHSDYQKYDAEQILA